MPSDPKQVEAAVERVRADLQTEGGWEAFEAVLEALAEAQRERDEIIGLYQNLVAQDGLEAGRRLTVERKVEELQRDQADFYKLLGALLEWLEKEFGDWTIARQVSTVTHHMPLSKWIAEARSEESKR